jgi:hypothetical protein
MNMKFVNGKPKRGERGAVLAMSDVWGHRVWQTVLDTKRAPRCCAERSPVRRSSEERFRRHPGRQKCGCLW